MNVFIKAPECQLKALQFAQRYLETGETDFMAFAPQDFEEEVRLRDRAIRITAQSHIVRVRCDKVE